MNVHIWGGQEVHFEFLRFFTRCSVILYRAQKRTAVFLARTLGAVKGVGYPGRSLLGSCCGVSAGR